jgi:hypothetical protein
VRARLGFRVWRSVHWLAYACWPIALLHGLGSGSDTKLGWMLLLSIACIAAVLGAAAWRVVREPRFDQGARVLVLGSTAAALAGLVAWAAQGPLAAGWARRAGTPTALLAGSARPVRSSAISSSPHELKAPFTANLTGTVRQGTAQGGAASVVNIGMRMSGGARGTLTVAITGTPVAGGGVEMTASEVTLRPASGPPYSGRITGLQGASFTATVASASGRSLDLQADLQLDQSTQAVSGELQAQQGAAP